MVDLMARIRSFLARNRAQVTDPETFRDALRREKHTAKVVRQLDREVGVLSKRLNNHIESGHH